MSRYTRDPKWIESRFAGKDRNGTPFKRGERIFYYPASKTILAGEAAKQAAADFEAHRQDDDGY